MTDTTEVTASTAGDSTPRGGLSALKLDELKQLAASMGIRGTSKMRKSDLVAAIGSGRSGGGLQTTEPAARRAPRRATSTGARPASAPDAAATLPGTSPVEPVVTETREPSAPRGAEDRAVGTIAREERPAEGRGREAGQQNDRQGQEPRGDHQGEEARGERGDRDRQDGGNRQGGNDNRDRQGNENRGNRGDRQGNESRGERGDRDRDRQDGGNRQGGNDNRDRQGNENRDNRGDRQGGNDRQGNESRGERGDRDRQDGGNRQGNQNRSGNRDGGNRDSGNRDDDERRGRRRQRGRDRKRGRGRAEDFGDVDTQVREDDVLVPVAGILDVLDNYAFVRTSGYLPGSNDVYVPLGMVKKNGMRKGDAITGAIKALREGEQPPARQKFNALVRVDTVNGQTPDEAGKRVEFSKLTPLYPQERLRLEDDQKNITNRVIDLVAPIGKGQRGLIVAPAKSGKTLVMQSIANAITTNNPECHLMVVLVDERPEEVTDFQRSVKGEVIASTFDRPAADHTEVAELAIERAKRLVEMGHDVVVLLDGITRLGRAYNLAAPASGRIMSGGVDSAALYPPKKFFGAARNIENGGSLTILATALIDSGSKMDEVIFEEFKGTGNWELRLSRQLAERRIFPAVDVNASGTRREEILLAGDELKIMWKLRRVLAALDSQQSVELLLDRLRKTKSNVEFLMQVQQTSSIKLDDED
ncbi:transcription termination factor Rho [Luteipulveratus sp. YIM 133132]|uniref:transcription termination factor Rho n=1 Tax=Luteipulveratus flavus TaxID=3031728 RepID=UPI0023B0A65D|nr:transcription termination factor Rho [Luteipulveratus sp. YIM 133132]MDE9365922.1 transcription termination factor Rho [Luteipulveratus sp. YIM 133132]